MGVLDGIVKGKRSSRRLGGDMSDMEYPWNLTKEGEVTKIESDDDVFKQLLFGWAGGGSAAMELYGNEVGGGLWEWELSSSGVHELERSLKLQLKEPKKYKPTKKEQKFARQLLKELE